MKSHHKFKKKKSERENDLLFFNESHTHHAYTHNDDFLLDERREIEREMTKLMDYLLLSTKYT